MNNKGKHAKQKYQVVEIYTVLLFIAFIFMSIGYAQISDIDMIISGQAEATAQDGVFIYEVGDAVGTNGADAANSTVETYFGSNLGTKVVLGDSTESTISYTVSLYNNSSDRYVFVGVSDPAIYDNDDIVYTLSSNMIVGSTILEPNGNGKSLDFTVTFKYADGVTLTETNKVLNSMLNFRFKELPRVVLNVGKTTDAVSEAVDIYPGFGTYEYPFIVENFDGTATNKVEMEYTLGLEVAELPEGISESPLTVTLDNDSDTSNEALIEDILIAGGDGVEEKTDNYVLRIAWNDKALNGDKKYNSADFAGKTFKYKVTLTGTPSAEKYETQYLDYQFVKSFILEVTTAPLNFNVNMTEADIFMEGEKASLALGISNNSDVAYDTEYNVKVNDNTKFTPSISGATITSKGAERKLDSGIDTNDVFTIDFAADVNDIDRKESVNLLLSLIAPYVKEITIPVNIRSIAMSAQNAKDGNDATGTNAQVTNGNVNVTINCDGTYLDSVNNKNLQYAVVEAGGASLSESNWQTIATSEISNLNTTNATVTKEITVNENVYARYFDGTSGQGVTQIAIDNIDKESPNAFSVKQDEVSTYSVKVSGSTTDNGSTGTAEKYVGVSGYQYQLKNESGTVLKAWTPETETKETSYTFVSNTSNNLEITQGTKYIVSMRAIDKAGNISEESSVEVTTKTVAESNKTTIGIAYSRTENGPDPVTVYFTNNSDDSSLVIKYQIGNTDGNWLDYDSTKGVTVEENTSIYARLFDEVGQTSTTTTTAVANVTNIVKVTLKVGDFVNYNAGDWASSDESKITSSGGSVTWGTTPSAQGQFGGYTVGYSRNKNASGSYIYETYGIPDYEGWRVWSISGDVVTLISAGHPEVYYHRSNGNESLNILTKRDCTMYVNSYATEAHILTGDEARIWHNTQFGTTYAAMSNFIGQKMSTASPVDVLDNNAHYWLASVDGAGNLYYVNPSGRIVFVFGGGLAYRRACPSSIIC